MTDSSEYTPIDCTFHDRLEDVAVRGVVVELIVTEGATQTKVRGRIKDVFARGGADWAKIHPVDSDQILSIRLDYIVALDGFARPGASGHC